MKASIKKHPGKNQRKEKPELTLKEAIIASEVRYRRLFEAAKDGILILDAATGKIIDVNPFLIDLMGYWKDYFIEKEIWEIGLLKDIAANKERFSALQQKEYVRYDNLPLETADGRIINVEFVSNVYFVNKKKMIQCNIRDITERRNIQNAINFQADLLNNVGHALIATDVHGNVIYWNSSAEKIYGWSSVEAMGQKINNLTPAQQTKEQAEELMKKLSEGKTCSGEFLVKRKDGSSFPAYVTDTPIIDAKGKLIGLIGISSDITERKLTEKELIKAKEKAEESDRLKAAFLANISHEIRTPMNGILGFTELLKRPMLTGEKKKKYIGIIEKSSARMLNIINDIVNLSKIESGQMKISVSDTNVNEVIDNILNFFKQEAEQRKIQISYKNTLPVKEAIVKTDRVKISAVLSNLVENAIKFTENGSIEFGYEKKGDCLEFFVKDTGIGIPQSQKELIFERFRQGSESFNRKYEGAGLGLSISKAYIEMLGGKIWVECNPDRAIKAGIGSEKGSTFFFTIPYHPRQLTEITDMTDLDDNIPDDQSRKLKVLIAEDDRLSQILLTRITERIVKEFIKVSTGPEAVEACRYNPDIDLILMDIKMPEMDGYEATRQIRKFNKEVAIIAQTTYGLAGEKAKAIRAGCNDYIAKPVDPALLIKKIKSILI